MDIIAKSSYAAPEAGVVPVVIESNIMSIESGNIGHMSSVPPKNEDEFTSEN